MIYDDNLLFLIVNIKSVLAERMGGGAGGGDKAQKYKKAMQNVVI